MSPVDNSCISRATVGKIVLAVGAVIIVAALVAAAAAAVLAIGGPPALLAAASVFMLSAKGMAGVASLLGVIGVGLATLGTLCWKTAASCPIVNQPAANEFIKLQGIATEEHKQLIREKIQSYYDNVHPIYKENTKEYIERSVFVVYEIDTFRLSEGQESHLQNVLKDEKGKPVVLILHTGYKKGRLMNEEDVKKGHNNIKFIYLKMEGENVVAADGDNVDTTRVGENYHNTLLAIFNPKVGE